MPHITLTWPQPESLDDEWLLTNGLGSYAMGTVAGCNLRRYHGLFIVATRPPVGRIVALNQVLEQLDLGGKKPIEFTTCAFHKDGRAMHAPDGHQRLSHFARGLHVAWEYAHDGVTLRRELFLHWRKQAATLRYTITGLKKPATLRLSPMMSLRDFHSLQDKAGLGDFTVDANGDRICVQRGDHTVTLACDAGTSQVDADWWYQLHYPRETQRGQDDLEDNFVPGRFDVALNAGDEQVVNLTVHLGDQPATPEPSTSTRAKHLAPMFSHVDADDAKKLLVIAADDFVVERTIKGDTLSTILAGYPWFADWGRDTFIALPGLLLTTRRYAEARATLRVFAEAIQDGLAPNRFDDYDDAAAHYNTVDASLWYVQAAIAYVHASGDRDAWYDWLAEAVKAIIEAYLHGTKYDIALGGDGLIAAGSPDTQLTWMDAADDGVVFTPRCGKAVEINALWHHVLEATGELIKAEDAKTADHYRRLAQRAKRAFGKVFWDDRLGYLRDHVWTDEQGQEHADDSLRPNQIFACSLAHSPLPRTKQRKVIQVVRDRLLTPYGLRTLPTDDPHYHGTYGGSRHERDEAYHQGTVWPWLIGPYAEGVLRAGQFSPKAIQEAKSAIAPLIEFLTGPGLGQLHEIHEADAPHRAVGCVAQAWSVAEVLRVLRMIETSP